VTRPARTTRRDAATGALLFGLAFAFRALYVAQIADQPAVRYPVLDALAYHQWALALVEGTWQGGVYYQDPLYPTFLSLLYRLFGPDSLGVLLAQAALDAGSVVLLWATARRLFGSVPALVSGLLAAFYAVFVFYAALLLKAPLLLFLFNLCFLLLVRAAASGKALAWLAAGVALGLAALTRANALLFVPLWLLWIALDRRRPAAARALGAAAACAGVALALLPVAVRNHAVGGEWVLVNSQGGQNFYIGNFRGNDTGGYRAPPFLRADPKYEEEDFAREAEKALGRDLTPAQVSSYWWRRGLEEILADPGHFLRHTGRKLLVLVNHHEIADNYSFDFVADVAAPMLRWPLPSFGLLLPVALCGAFFARRERAVWLLFAFAASYAASLVLFFNLSRLRLPLAPLVILFAGKGLVELFRRARAREWRTLAAAALCLAVAYPVIYADVAVDRISIRYYNLGQRHMSVSFEQQRRAVELSAQGDEAGARDALARATRERVEAERIYLRGLEKAPRSRRLNQGLRDLWVVHATTLHRLGRDEDAILVISQLTRRYPKYPPGHAWLATLYASQGRRDEALAEARRALELDPEDARALRVRRELAGSGGSGGSAGSAGSETR
jgi:4-amino-4-deoxy-L-arabinose transferase-like glycosyltransferase